MSDKISVNDSIRQYLVLECAVSQLIAECIGRVSGSHALYNWDEIREKKFDKNQELTSPE